MPLGTNVFHSILHPSCKAGCSPHSRKVGPAIRIWKIALLLAAIYHLKWVWVLGNQILGWTQQSSLCITLVDGFRILHQTSPSTNRIKKDSCTRINKMLIILRELIANEVPGRYEERRSRSVGHPMWWQRDGNESSAASDIEHLAGLKLGSSQFLCAVPPCAYIDSIGASLRHKKQVKTTSPGRSQRFNGVAPWCYGGCMFSKLGNLQVHL